MPKSVHGSEARRAPLPAMRRNSRRGFTLIELLVVIALVAIGSAVVSLALRDRGTARLEEEGARLAALLESARAESRATGLAVRWVPGSADTVDNRSGGFRFVGLPATVVLPGAWLDADTSAQVVGAPTLVLGPDAIIPAQRVVLSLGDHRLEIGTDGLAPFDVVDANAVPQPAGR